MNLLGDLGRHLAPRRPTLHEPPGVPFPEEVPFDLDQADDRLRGVVVRGEAEVDGGLAVPEFGDQGDRAVVVHPQIQPAVRRLHEPSAVHAGEFERLDGHGFPASKGPTLFECSRERDFSPSERSEVAMVLWIGVDDTDSLRGMCTTFLAAELVRDLTRDFDLVGYPRLVRLNPNIPWKTRGNAAVCLRIGSGRGEPMTVGELGGRPIQTFPRGRCDEPPARVLDRVSRLVERWSRMGEASSGPWRQPRGGRGTGRMRSSVTGRNPSGGLEGRSFPSL